MAFLLALQMFSLLPPHSRPLFNALIVLSFFVDIFLYFFFWGGWRSYGRGRDYHLLYAPFYERLI